MNCKMLMVLNFLTRLLLDVEYRVTTLLMGAEVMVNMLLLVGEMMTML